MFPRGLAQLAGEGTGGPEYNTVDASLWFILAAFHYVRYTKDFDFVRDHLWGRMKEIITHYQNGTQFHIRMDLDGLIDAGQADSHLTWMDAKLGDEAITPPMTPRGRAMRIEIGMGQLSYRAARHRKITRMEKA